MQQKTMNRITILALAIILLMGLTTPTYSQIPTPFGIGKKDKDKDKKEEKKATTDDTLTIPILAEYGKKKYQSEADFKLEVDKAYEIQRREHQQKAFSVNIQAPLRVMGDLEGEGGNSTARYSGAMAASNGPVDALYENPMLQDYINRIGQSLVPASSTKLYAFRILQDPIPRAESLSTGTIYISTGLLGMLDNEAQLAYVLSHEIAHGEKEHWFNQVQLQFALKEYNEDKEAEAAEINRRKARKRQLIRLIATGATAGIAGGAYGLAGAGGGAYLGYGVGGAVGNQFVRDTKASTLGVTEWGVLDEDEADKTAFEFCLANNYDVQEIPKLYAVVKSIVTSDPRAGLGFMGAAHRVEERISTVEKQLAENKSKIEEHSKQGKLIISKGDFEVLMAEVKRDNGVIAFYYDMFDMSKRNLEWSLRVRSDDAKAHYYYARVLKITARNEKQKDHSLAEFATAYKLDQERASLPGIRLQMAISLMDLRNASKNPEIVQYLKDYVRIYKLNNSGAVPPNMDIIYDYLTQSGDKNWFTAPASNVSTQDIAPVNVQALNVSAPIGKQETDKQETHTTGTKTKH